MLRQDKALKYVLLLFLIKNREMVNVSFKGNTFENNPVKLIAVFWGAKEQKPEVDIINDSREVKVVENLKLKLVY